MKLIIVIVALVVFVVLGYLLWQYFKAQEKRGDEILPPIEKPQQSMVATEALKKIPKQPKKYHARAADEPPGGQTKREIDFDHQVQREEILKAQQQRGDLLEPASQREQATQGHGKGLPPHPLMASMPQGSAANLSINASENPNAEANADAHPENTPVPTAELHNQAKAQATFSPSPHMPGS